MYQNIERSNIYDTIFHFMIFETLNYIIKKENIEIKEKLLQIDELGCHLGERITNHLLNKNNMSTNTKMEVDEILKFLGRDVWLFIFNKQITKLQTNRKGTFLIDCDELKFHHSLITEKNGPTDILEHTLCLISGIIKGVLNTFNYESNVNATFKLGPIINLLLNNSNALNSSVDTKGQLSMNSLNPCSYSFTISLLNLNY